MLTAANPAKAHTVCLSSVSEVLLSPDWLCRIVKAPQELSEVSYMLQQPRHFSYWWITVKLDNSWPSDLWLLLPQIHKMSQCLFSRHLSALVKFISLILSSQTDWSHTFCQEKFLAHETLPHVPRHCKKEWSWLWVHTRIGILTAVKLCSWSWENIFVHASMSLVD